MSKKLLGGTMLDVLIAMALIMGEPEDAHLVDKAVLEMCMPTTIKDLALQCQWMDERESQFFIHRIEDFSSDLRNLRNRYRSLKDAPLVEDSMRFPHRSVVNEYLATNRQYRQHLDVLSRAYPQHYWDINSAIQSTDCLYQIWDTVRDCTCEYYYVTVRRQCLLTLQKLIGQEAYYSTNLPPYVPLRYFQEIK